MDITIWQYIETFCRDHHLISLTNIIAIPLIGYFANRKEKDIILKMKSIFIAWFAVFYTVFMMTLNIVFYIDTYVNAIIGAGILLSAVIFRYLFFRYKTYIG